MNIYDVGKNIIDAVRVDAQFVAFCAAEFDKQPSYILGLDEDNPPPNAEMPLVIIVPLTTNETTFKYNEHRLSCGVACSDSTVSSVNYTGYEGYSTVADFEKALFNAVQRHFDETEDDHTRTISEWTPASYRIYFPQFHAVREITVSDQYTDFR